ncbi:GatB/YqeY domain-containing protein [Pseudomonadota bacterium]
MALKNRLQQDLMEAMKAKEDLKVSALRMLKASILKFEVSGERKEATDEDVLSIINKEIKQRKDSAEQFKAGNRFEQAEQEEAEVEILQAYMPPQMSEQEITNLAKEAVAATGASSPADIGKVMGALMPKVKGKADGSLVNKVVASLLS